MDKSVENGGLSEYPQLLDYDKILPHLGGFGRFQLRVMLLLWIASMYCSMATMSISFTAASLDHRCSLPECGDERGRSNLWTESINSSSYPSSSEGKCSRYHNVTDDGWCAPLGNSSEVKCSEWIYDQSVVSRSIVSEFNLVCDKSWVEPVLGSAYMIGMFIGSGVFGPLADKIGRKNCLMLTAAATATEQVIAAFSVNPIMFFFMRILAGATGVGLYLVLTVTGFEFVGSQYRFTCGFIVSIFYSLGSCLVGLLAIGIKDWRFLQLTTALPGFLILTYWWFIPEPARWLTTKGRYVEARQVILKAAKENKKNIPEYLLYIPSEMPVEEKESTVPSHSDSEPSRGVQGNMIDVLKNPVLRKRALSMFFVWFAVSMCYYGLSMVVTTLSSDYILNYELVMIVEIPSYIAGILLVNTLGRRTMLSIAMLGGGIACITAGALPDDPSWLPSVFSLLGKFFVSAAYAIIYSYTAELFPTAVRLAAVGSSSMAARVGSILAPFIASTGSAGRLIPFTIFGVSALLSGFAIVMLPETMGSPLPQTFQDALDLQGSRMSLPCCRTKAQEERENEEVEEKKKRAENHPIRNSPDNLA